MKQTKRKSVSGKYIRITEILKDVIIKKIDEKVDAYEKISRSKLLKLAI